MVCFSTPYHMAPGGEKRKFTFFSLQLAVAQGCKIDGKKVSEFYAKLPWESSLHDRQIQRYQGQIIVGAEGFFAPTIIFLSKMGPHPVIMGEILAHNVMKSDSTRQEEVEKGREIHGRIEESLSFRMVTMRTSWYK